MGLRSLDDGYVPPILDVSKLDRKLLVSNAEAVAGLHALLDREGVFAGVSSGAVIHTCARVASRMTRGTIVGIGVLASGRGGMKFALPFGTFLALGAALAATVGPGLLEWYMGFL